MSNSTTQDGDHPDDRTNATALALDRISNPAKFEQLATAILRRKSPLCASISHTGLSAEGKPIKAQVDGIAELPGSTPVHLVTVQHSTVARSELKRKWLGTAGDIQKAAAILKSAKQTSPNAQMTLFLTTNRVPSVELMRQASELARSLGLHVEIFDRSRLADFLDHDPDGQYIRKQYLGLAQERLSRQQLNDISSESTRLLTAEVHDDAALLVARELDGILYEGLLNIMSATFLVMPSGMGKTAGFARLMQSWTADKDRFAIWISETLVDNCVTLNEAMGRAMREVAPSIEPNAAAVARTLGHPEQPVLIVIDDVSRSSRAGMLLERVLAWARAEESKDATVRIFCSAQPQLLEQVSPKAKQEIQARSLSHGRFSEAEATAAVQRRAGAAVEIISATEAREIARSLAYDPLLIALAWSYRGGLVTDLTSVVPNFIEHQLVRCTALPGAFVISDYRRALRALAVEMLRRRSLNPTWLEVVGWFAKDAEALACIKIIAAQRVILRLEAGAGGEHLGFRHDRVRNSILASAVSFGIEDVHRDILADPYFSEVVGLAIATTKSEGLLDAVQMANPLALCYALKHLSARSTMMADRTALAISAWLEEHADERVETKHLQWAMQFALAETEHPSVPDIVRKFTVKGMNQNWALLRNGDALGGLKICARYGPRSRYVYRDDVIKHVVDRYGEQFVNQVAGFVVDVSLTANERRGILNLAGFIGIPNLGTALAEAWKAWGHDPQYFSEFLWAALQCTASQPERLLDRIIDFWETLPEKDERPGAITRTSGLDELQVAFNRWIPEPALWYLIRQAGREGVRWPIQVLLRHANHPAAAEFTAERYAAVLRSQGTQIWWPLEDHNAGYWPLSSVTREHLKSLVARTEKDAFLRRAALTLWTQHAKLEDVAFLQSFAADSALSERALQVRVRLGDRSALPLLQEKLAASADSGIWLQYARGSWDDDLQPVIEAELERRAAQISAGDEANFRDSVLAELIMQCSAPTAELMLVRHWNHLGNQGAYVRCALFIATPACRELVRRSMDTSKLRELLQYLGMSWHIGGTEQRGRLTMDRLAAIEPYLDLLDKHGIEDVWNACNVDGFFDWRREHVDSRLRQLEQERQRYALDEETIWRELDSLYDESRLATAEFFSKQFEERGDPPQVLLQAMRRWLLDRKSSWALRAAGEILSLIGSRADLSLLEGVDGPEADAIRVDVAYAVQLRSLN